MLEEPTWLLNCPKRKWENAGNSIHKIGIPCVEAELVVKLEAWKVSRR